VNVTWTISNRGEMSDVPSGVAGPITYQALDRTQRDAIAPFHPRGQGLDCVIRAPVVMVTGIAPPVGYTMQELQAAGNMGRVAARASRAAVTRSTMRRKAGGKGKKL
jgi:hypothetical protein